eukprot:2905123-Alexandrium_andersonii.AAC.1
MHKGLPEVTSYLLGKPEFYCSHSFQNLYLYPLVQIVDTALRRRLRQTADGVVQADVNEPMGL